jgi:hypothetical protein
MLRIFARRPEGAATNQPRATPWDCANQPRSCPERAKQGARFVAPLQGFGYIRIPIPRALPWDFLSGPLQGKFQNSATSKRASEGVRAKGRVRWFHALASVIVPRGRVGSVCPVSSVRVSIRSLGIGRSPGLVRPADRLHATPCYPPNTQSEPRRKVRVEPSMPSLAYHRLLVRERTNFR